MQLEVGSIVEGKVTGITGFGAFVEVDKGQTGLVHISEVASEYVKDIKEHLKLNQEVKVKVISLENNKIFLSIKQAQEPKKRAARKPSEIDWSKKNSNAGMSFEDMMAKFKQSSDERMLDIKRSNEAKRGVRR